MSEEVNRNSIDYKNEFYKGQEENIELHNENHALKKAIIKLVILLNDKELL